jgi:hypothetical protein
MIKYFLHTLNWFKFEIFSVNSIMTSVCPTASRRGLIVEIFQILRMNSFLFKSIFEIFAYKAFFVNSIKIIESLRISYIGFSFKVWFRFSSKLNNIKAFLSQRLIETELDIEIFDFLNLSLVSFLGLK